MDAANDVYELVRQKLQIGPIYAPKHKLIYELLKELWDEEEIEVVALFEGIGKLTSPRKLAKISEFSKDKLKEILNRLADRGTILKLGNQYGLLPLLPGVFELYYSVYKDAPKKLAKIAKLYRAIFDEILPQQLINTDFTLFRPLLPYKTNEQNLITINQSLSSQTQVLSIELVNILLDKYDIFCMKPCDCRRIGELSGNPCSIASAEMGCLFCGLAAQFLIERGIGTPMTKAEALEFIKATEEAGLVHNTLNTSDPMIICNCCSCHCGTLYPFKSHRVSSVTPSNFHPQFNSDLCIKCEKCLKMCPMGAIYHHWPREADSSDEKMVVRSEFCIGCGVCASNCPKNAITMEKIRDTLPPKQFTIGDKNLLDLLL
ncbi:MAG: 4Fe-4S binding protein [Candidatus Helarchaeota archaeon]